MLHKIKIIFLIALLVLSIGCTNTTNPSATLSATNKKLEVTIPSISKEEVLIIPIQNFNLTFYKNCSYARFFCFDIVSTQQISEATAEIDIKTPYTFSFNINENELRFPYYVFQNYQTVDWKLMHDLYLKNLEALKENTVYQPFLDYRDLYVDDYLGTVENIAPLYHYNGTIAFDMDKADIDSNEVINTIKFNINGNNYTVNVGSIMLDYTTKYTYPTKNIKLKTLSMVDRKIIPHPNGTIPGTFLSFTCEKDILIKGFKLLESSVEITDIDITTQYNNKTMTQKYSIGKPLLCKAGTQVDVNLKVDDANFIGRMLYSTSLHLVIEYETEGEQSTAFFESIFRTRPEPYEVYASEYDKVNFISYYYDFASLTYYG